MGAPEMYSEAYQEYMTGDAAHDRAFAALADCPSFAQVEAALNVYAHELAEKIRSTDDGRCVGTDCCGLHASDFADLIDPEVAQ